jgi:hypothetical protein
MVSNSSIKICLADQGSSGAETAEKAVRGGTKLTMVEKMHEQSEFIVQPKWWIIKRTQGCRAWFVRVAKDYVGRAETFALFPWIRGICFMQQWSP